jgi:SAM-dependent methyltransferase
MQLNLGCGYNRKIKIIARNNEKEIGSEALFDEDAVHVDINPNVKPTILHDLNILPLPFKDNQFDEIHAYDVLEHLHSQGDYKWFFTEWNEYWRILKPNGMFFGICPSFDSFWAWGDPGHTRLINEGTLTFLSQAQYKQQCGLTPMSDYRYLYHGDFVSESYAINKESFMFILRALK